MNDGVLEHQSPRRRKEAAEEQNGKHYARIDANERLQLFKYTWADYMRSIFRELLIVEEFNKVKPTLYFMHSLSNESTFQTTKYMKIIAVALLRHSAPSPPKSLDMGKKIMRMRTIDGGLLHII